jgi:hypothetical protein
VVSKVEDLLQFVGCEDKVCVLHFPIQKLYGSFRLCEEAGKVCCCWFLNAVMYLSSCVSSLFNFMLVRFFLSLGTLFIL